MSDLQSQTALLEPPGGAVPSNGQPAQAEPEGPLYGENNEDLPENLQTKLKELARKFSDEDKFSRRLEIQTSKRAHWYWRSLQHLVWDQRAEGWVALGPNGAPLMDGAGRQAYNKDSAVLYTTNIYQPYGLTLISVLTQNIPEVIAVPADGEDAADLATARAGNRIRKIIEHENDATMLLTEAMFFAYVDGRIHAWTRNEKDEATGKEKPVITISGTLETKVPITAKSRKNFVYIQHSYEQHVAIAKHENPKFKKKIKGGAQGSGQDVYERTARISVAQGTSYMSGSGDTLQNLSTVQETWMRLAAFELLEKDEDQQDPELEQLRELFPNGCRVKLVSGEYVGSWAENMDDHWAVFNALPGDGQFRNSMGHTEESVQERFNDIINIAQDTYEKTIPASWKDSKLVDANGIFRQQSKPGASYPIVKEPGTPISEHFFFEPPATVSADMLAYGDKLMNEISQLETGAFTALMGGGEAKGAAGDTASGYAMQREQAMGRMGLIYRGIKRWWAETIGQAVKCAALLQADLSLSIPSESGQIETTQVRIEELQGDVHWYPESDEGFPESWSSKRQTYMSLLPMADANPMLAQILAEPRNQETAQHLIGLEDFKLPIAESWAKQMMEINELLDGQPMPNPQFAALQQKHQQLTQAVKSGQMVPDEEIMQLQQQSQGIQQFNPSVPIDAEFDNHAAEFETVKAWLSSPDGLKAKVEKPDGFANVRFHGLAHKQAAMQQMAGAPPPPQGHPPAGHAPTPHGAPKPPSAPPPQAAQV